MSHWVYNCEKNTECYNLLVQMQKNYYIIFFNFEQLELKKQLEHFMNRQPYTCCNLLRRERMRLATARCSSVSLTMRRWARG